MRQDKIDFLLAEHARLSGDFSSLMKEFEILTPTAQAKATFAPGCGITDGSWRITASHAPWCRSLTSGSDEGIGAPSFRPRVTLFVSA